MSGKIIFNIIATSGFVLGGVYVANQAWPIQPADVTGQRSLGDVWSILISGDIKGRALEISQDVEARLSREIGKRVAVGAVIGSAFAWLILS